MRCLLRTGNLAGRLTVFAGNGAIDVEAASSGRFAADPQAIYDRWDEFVDWAATDGIADQAQSFDEQELRAPAPRPRQVFAIGVNYQAHAEEAAGQVSEELLVFAKWPSSFAGPFGDIVLPGERVDWETELVVVIGKRAKNVPAAEGWEHIAGVTVGQDISERSVQTQGAYPQWGLGKSFPGFSPTGPWLVSVDEFANPDDLVLECTVNGHQMQKARTSELVVPVPELVAELSRVVTLYPGDVIFTGTPAGVGAVRTPPVYLRPGDTLVTTIEGIGHMAHRFVTA